MSLFPITPLVCSVQKMIVLTFDISEQEAQEYAAEMVALAEGWGSSDTVLSLDWSYRIKKDLGETKKLKWRSNEEHIKFEATERLKYAAWDAFINTKHRA
jgi:hypothetical protein